METKNQTAKISGVILNELSLDHTVKNEKFYGFTVRVSRYSGANDDIPAIISEKLLGNLNLKEGIYIQLDGEFRSCNKVLGEKNRLILNFFVKNILGFSDQIEVDDQFENSIELEGQVCKLPQFRITPFGKKICDLLLAVNRTYGKSDYIPCIVWGNSADLANKLEIGDKVYLAGRIQSREYFKRISENETETRVAYEVSARYISKQ